MWIQITLSLSISTEMGSFQERIVATIVVLQQYIEVYAGI